MLLRILGTILVLASLVEAIHQGAALFAMPSDLAVITSIVVLVVSSYFAYKLVVSIWR